MKLKAIKLWMVISLLCGFTSVKGQQHGLTVDAPAVVALDEAFRVVYTASGKTKEFNPPQISDFQVLAGPTTSTMSSTNIINGKRTFMQTRRMSLD